MLCFVHGDWKLLADPFEVDGGVVTWPKALAERVMTHVDGPAAPALGVARAIRHVFTPMP